MRASRAPSSRPSASNASPIAGAIRLALACRSLRPARSACNARAASAAGFEPRAGRRVERTAGRKTERGEHRGRRDRDAGIGEHGGAAAQPSERGTELLAAAAPSGARAASRQTGTSAPTAAAAANSRSSFGARPLAAASARNAAAASLDPPPRPAATGRTFANGSAREPGAEPARRARAQRAAPDCSRSAPAAAAVGPSIVRLSISAGSNASWSQQPAKATTLSSSCQPSMRRAEHLQGQIDLGRGAPEPRRAVRQV